MITKIEGYIDFEFMDLESTLVSYDESINEYQDDLIRYMRKNQIRELDVSTEPELFRLKNDMDYKRTLLIKECIKIANKYPNFA